MLRKTDAKVQGYRTQDGAGVSLVRVLGHETTKLFDPFLMLDAFDSTDPHDYIKGFPFHPHRGIETFTFLSKGGMEHQDHLGTKATIHDGEAQWLTAGSGAYHAEMPLPSSRMLGIQLWLNLPAKDKMRATPFYHSVTHDEVKTFQFPGGMLRLMAGSYQNEQGIQGRYLPLDFYDIHLEAGASITLDVDISKTAMVFTLEGEAVVCGEDIESKTAVKLVDGDRLTIQAKESPLEILFISSLPLHETVAWYGPVVMNTREEINTAIKEMQEGTFIKDNAHYE